MTSLTRSQIIAATAAALTAMPRIGRTQTVETIRLCAPPTDDLIPVYWAIKNGAYRKVGLDVQFVPIALLSILSAIAPSYAVSAFFAQPDWARKNAGVVERFMRVTYNTAAYTNTHPAETAATVAEITKIPLAIIQKMTRVHSATKTAPAIIQPVIEVAAKYGYIARPFPAEELYFRS